MKRNTLLLITIGLGAMLACGGCRAHDPGNAKATPAAATPAASGTLEGGVRVITLDPAASAPVLHVYRGDYVRLALGADQPFTVTVDSLKLTWTWPVPEGDKPYLKMTETGRFAFRAGTIDGTLDVMEFKAAAYREVGGAEAAQVIANLRPFILDVRTPAEFAEGHLEGATLLPVQELEQRLRELSAHRQDPVLVYCHSGNRSTVASKMLVDFGFEQVINVRKGIADLTAAGLPLVR